MWKKFSQKERAGSGAIGARPRRRRCSAATMVGSFASEAQRPLEVRVVADEAPLALSSAPR